MKLHNISSVAVSVLILLLISCNNNQLVEQNKSLHIQDSTLMVQTQQNDSTIKGYIRSMNEIERNLDEIKAREKILKANSVNGEDKAGSSNALTSIKQLDELILQNHKEMSALQARLKKLNSHDKEMEEMITRLNTQISQQDTQMSMLQGELAKANTSIKEINDKFNDSIMVIHSQSVKIASMTNQMNTVYYTIGTLKELKDNNVINKSGGFVGIGRNASVKPDLNSSYFVKTDLTTLNVIPLNAKFKKLISSHPSTSYKVSGNEKVDSLWITDRNSFWSEEKYLVIAVK